MTVSILAGGAAGFFFWFLTYPFDTIKSKIQSDSLEKPKYKGIIDCI